MSPPFRVRVVDLDRLAVHRADDVARALGGAGRHVLDRGDDAEHVDLRLQRRDALHRTDDRRAAAHVALHLPHAGRGLDGDAAGIECDALADDGDVVLRVLRVARVLHDDEPRLVGTALRHGEHRAHPALHHVLPPQHRDRQPCLVRHVGRDLGHASGVDDVRRLVDEVAREDGAVGEECSLGRAGRERLHAARVALHDDQIVERLAVVPIGAVGLRAVALELVEAEQCALRHRLRGGACLQPADAGAVGDSRGALRPQLPQPPRNSARDGAHHVGVELLALAETCHDDALCRQLAERVDGDGLALPADDLLVCDERGDRPVQRLVHGAGPAAGRLHALEQVHDDGVRVGLRDGALLDSHSGHIALPHVLGVA